MIVEKTKIRFGFKSKSQLYPFMIWRETSLFGRVIYAEVLFAIRWPYA